MRARAARLLITECLVLLPTGLLACPEQAAGHSQHICTFASYICKHDAVERTHPHVQSVQAL